ncbi:S-adenosylmethionine decarboxylase proenzyme 4 [Striga hermonthica]|uniref:S-adenosylmethionine decarboxylase proenzyme n=1 Tax=Striga hermonthica TaxID=68872 RepID=A0A9N7NPU5_STRHE|nr:S-adenosylmethionine decarboxylase proenzyme 4 [Striga hermonthica]
MAASGFEGFEKRLELHFSGDDPTSGKGGLRRLDFPSLEKVLHAVQCTVVSAVGNAHFDSYVLSESSLFVYPTKIVIKTCGTTQLLKSVHPFIDHGLSLGLTLLGCRYTRGSFIFPQAQPYPHTSFKNEVIYLESNLPKSLTQKKASTMNSKSNHKWHVFTAFDDAYTINSVGASVDDSYTVEICMTELDPTLARNFFRFDGGKLNGDSAGKEMTRASGIQKINENALICDYAFDPCGYSMNGLDLDRYSTIHVTPEDGFSYASFECVGSTRDGRGTILEVLKRVIGVFGPGKVSVSTTVGPAVRNSVWRGMAKAVEPLGMRLTSCTAGEFPSAGSVVFQTFVADRK